MVSITFSIDDKTYDMVRRFMDETDIDSVSMAVRMLVKKGVAHDKEIRARLAAEHNSKL